MSPLIRSTPYGLLICGLFPTKMKNSRWCVYQLLLWLKSKGAFDGFDVWDADMKVWKVMKFQVLALVEDYRGLCKFISLL